MAWNASTPGRSRPSSFARATMGSPSGCSEPSSAPAASSSRSCSVKPSVTSALVTAGLPRVRVPVLSRTMVSMQRACSGASPPRIRMPSSAALPGTNAPPGEVQGFYAAALRRSDWQPDTFEIYPTSTDLKGCG